MDIKTLADTLTLFLAPAMPYLVSGGEEVVKAAGKAVREGGLEMAKKLWARLGPKVEEKPAAAEVAREVAKDPEDAAAQGALILQLRKILEADASLAAELAKLVAAAGPRETYFAQLDGSGAIAQGKGNVVAGAGGIAVGRDLKGGVKRDEEEG